MSERIDNGGPAFPVEVQPDSAYATGLSVRDYFAAKAMAGAVASTAFDDYEGNAFSCSDSWYAELAMHSYMIADAMMKAREP
jgi:hypothetical protein